MSFLQKVIAFLTPFVAVIEPLLMNAEGTAQAELQAIIANVSSPDLKLALQALDTAIDSFAKSEIQKL